MKDIKEKIKEIWKEEINPMSLEKEYHFKKLVIVNHAIRRFKERINLSKEYLLALIILEYPKIIKFINQNKNKLKNNQWIEYQIKYENTRFFLVIREDKFNPEKYVIKTIKKDYNSYLSEKYKSMSISYFQKI